MRRPFETKAHNEQEAENPNYGRADQPRSHDNNGNDDDTFISNSSVTQPDSALEPQLQPQNHDRKTPFRYHSRARDTTGPSQLHSRIRAARTGRCGSAFLDRLRASRRDERDQRTLDSVEKDEYWRDRRCRELRMRHEAEIETFAGELEEEEDDEGEEEYPEYHDGLTEDTDVDALVAAWYEEQRHDRDRYGNGDVIGPTQGSAGDQQRTDASHEFEDSEVEELFMHVLRGGNGNGLGDDHRERDKDTEMS